MSEIVTMPKHSPLNGRGQWDSSVSGSPDVTVVMRTQNRPLLLRRAIGSVLTQTHESWELIIVNDGGRPECVSEALSCWPEDPRIRVHHNAAALGMEAASNAGVSLGTGEFISIHDDDDSWMPGFLNATVTVLRSQRGRSLSGVITWVDRVDETIGDGHVRRGEEQSFNQWQKHVSAYRLLAANTFPPICLLFRRRCWEDLGGFNEALPVLGDWDFHWRLLLLGDVGIHAETLARYHHRIQGAANGGTYGNTVIAGVDKHQDFANRYRNEWVRETSEKGLLPVVALMAEQTITLHERFTQLEGLVAARREREARGVADERFEALEATIAEMKLSVSRSVDQVESVLADYNRYKARMPRWMRKVVGVNEPK